MGLSFSRGMQCHQFSSPFFVCFLLLLLLAGQVVAAGGCVKKLWGIPIFHNLLIPSCSAEKMRSSLAKLSFLCCWLFCFPFKKSIASRERMFGARPHRWKQSNRVQRVLLDKIVILQSPTNLVQNFVPQSFEECYSEPPSTCESQSVDMCCASI